MREMNRDGYVHAGDLNHFFTYENGLAPFFERPISGEKMV